MHKILRNRLQGMELQLNRDGGILVDMPKAPRTSVSATPDAAQAVRRLCAAHNRSESYVIERLALWLERQPRSVRAQLLEHVDDAFSMEYSEMVARSLATPISQQQPAADILSGQSPAQKRVEVERTELQSGKPPKKSPRSSRRKTGTDLP